MKLAPYAHSVLRFAPWILAALTGGCVESAPGGDAPGDEEFAGAFDLTTGALNGDATVLRTEHVTVAAGEIVRYRVTATEFRATLVQSASAGALPAKLSAKHYAFELESASGAEPMLDVKADGTLRNWTLRIHNLGSTFLAGDLVISTIPTTPLIDGGDGGEGGDGQDVPPAAGGWQATTELRREAVTVAAGQTLRVRVKAPQLRATLAQTTDVPAQVSAKSYEFDLFGAPGRDTTVDAIGDGTDRNWTLRLENQGTTELRGTLIVNALAWVEADDPADPGAPDDPATDPANPPTDPVIPFIPGPIPTLADPVQTENAWCIYQDAIPYVKDVKWSEPLVAAAMRAMTPGWRSMFVYNEWRVPYGLEGEANTTDAQKAQIRARNFLRVLCGEHRDQPSAIASKLQVVVDGARYAGPSELTSVDTEQNLFAQLTYPAYERLVAVMDVVYRSREAALAHVNDGFNFGRGAYVDSRRRENAVLPWTQCEMKFVFSRYLVAGAARPDWLDESAFVATYEAGYRAYQAGCSSEDFAWMYNFRGHVNFQPLWLESNGFIMNSRRARGEVLSRGQSAYYQHPFASRRARARAAWGAYLLYPEQDHAAMVSASQSGGGNILYITDQDADLNGIADYRLFDALGCGDQGVSEAVPSKNCNMVSWGTAFDVTNTVGAASGWSPTWIDHPDMGFLAAFPTFETRAARFNQALDRHTNWGPTGYYMIDASDVDDFTPRFFGAYSPVVAASYEISKSDWFAKRDYTSTDAFEEGQTKWMYVMRFPAAHYYDGAALRAGRALDFDHDYFSEPALSNDYYSERALDHFGWIPDGELHAIVYLVYGDRGEDAPAPIDVPAP